MESYGLDPHGLALLEAYRALRPCLERLEPAVVSKVRADIADKGLMVTAVDSRIKKESSLAGKLSLKGGKYGEVTDVTDLLGVRVITFYSDDVDKIASMVENLFDIDRENSVDKRKMHELDSFGYNSLHYVCRAPGLVPGADDIRFEVQIRTALQHVWATLYHDTGYKSGIEIPREYLRDMNRLAGMLELVDEQFCRIRTGITDYRRRVETLVADGRLDEVALDGDTYRRYLLLRPFDRLNRRIAALNQAEIQEVPLIQFLPLLRAMGMETLGDLDRMVRERWEDAYQLAVYQLGVTDLDIISSSVALQNLCFAYILRQGGGRAGLRRMFDTLNGPSDSNDILADMICKQAETLKII